MLGISSSVVNRLRGGSFFFALFLRGFLRNSLLVLADFLLVFFLLVFFAGRVRAGCFAAGRFAAGRFAFFLVIITLHPFCLVNRGCLRYVTPIRRPAMVGRQILLAEMILAARVSFVQKHLSVFETFHGVRAFALEETFVW